MPTLNVINQRLNRDVRTDEHWGATHDIRIGLHDRRFPHVAPLEHSCKCYSVRSLTANCNELKVSCRNQI